MDIGREIRVIEVEELDFDISPLEVEPEEERVTPGPAREDAD